MRRKKSLVGWALKKPFLRGRGGWHYIDDGKYLIPICSRKNFEKSVNIKMFKKVKITIEEPPKKK